MDDLIELLIELALEGSHELLKSKKVPKWIRYIITLVFISIIMGVIVLGIMLLKESIIGGSIIIGTGLLLLIGLVVKVINYLKN